AWQVRDLAFSQDGSRLVIYSGKPRSASTNRLGEVSLVNVAAATIESRHPTLFDGTVFFGAARLSPDNQRLYLARSDQRGGSYNIQCLNLATGQEVWQTEVLHGAGLTALAGSPDGRTLVSGSG